MRRIFSILLVLILTVMLAVSVSAAQMPRLLDSADLLTATQKAELLQGLDTVSQELRCDVVIITMQSCGGYNPDTVIDQLYDQYNYGYGSTRDGVVLLLSMAERDWRILSNGFAADAITLGEIGEIGDQIVDELSAGAYMDAFQEFIDLCEQEINGERYGFPFQFGLWLAVSLGIGLVTALIATAVMCGQLKSVRSQTGARQYCKLGDFHVTNSRDLLLYSNVDRRPRPKESSYSSSGSSGFSGSRGGGGRNIGGGKF